FPPGYLDEYNGDQVTKYAITFLVLEVLFLSLRFIARSMGKVPWGWDDSYLIAAAVLCAGIAIAGLCDIAYGGVGYHAPRIAAESPEKIIVWAKFTIIFPLLYYPGVALPKLSILALYFRVFGNLQNPIPRKICWFTGALIVGNCIGNMVPAFLICRPLNYVWNKNLEGGGTCDIQVSVWWRWSSLVNIITDVIMLALPVPAILKLQAPKKVKAGLAATFITGSIGLITAIIRFVGFFTLNYQVDITWTATHLIVVTIVEPQLYLIAACLLSFRPLLR
ncbi:hypothetical protein K469DRAFT_448133, partial [Zopfia rhizophila CBS 207.26]